MTARIRLPWRVERYLESKGDTYEWGHRGTVYPLARAYELAREHGGVVVPC